MMVSLKVLFIEVMVVVERGLLNLRRRFIIPSFPTTLLNQLRGNTYKLFCAVLVGLLGCPSRQDDPQDDIVRSSSFLDSLSPRDILRRCRVATRSIVHTGFENPRRLIITFPALSGSDYRLPHTHSE